MGAQALSQCLAARGQALTGSERIIKDIASEIRKSSRQWSPHLLNILKLHLCSVLVPQMGQIWRPLQCDAETSSQDEAMASLLSGVSPKQALQCRECLSYVQGSCHDERHAVDICSCNGEGTVSVSHACMPKSFLHCPALEKRPQVAQKQTGGSGADR